MTLGGLALEPLCEVGMTLGSVCGRFLGHVGMALGLLWCHFGLRSGCLWVHLGYLCGHVRMALGLLWDNLGFTSYDNVLHIEKDVSGIPLGRRPGEFSVAWRYL